LYEQESNAIGRLLALQVFIALRGNLFFVGPNFVLAASPSYKTLQELKGKKIAISGGVGGTNYVALVIALEKSGVTRKIT
jgi:ABC-type nitrate/sulfonate/bicarbonate transport system substrate-binding protein